MSISGSTSAPSSAGFLAGGAIELAALRMRLAGVDGDRLTDAGRVDLIEELERLKAAAAAAQARVTVAFAESQTEQALAGLPEAATVAVRRRTRAEAARSVAAQVGLARHDSPARGHQHLGLARALVTEMPHTMTALSRGDISEWRATIVARETGCLSREDRIRTDTEIAPRLPDLGDKRLADAVRGIAQRLDPASAVRRAGKAVSERRVSLRPAPDTMSYLTGLLPVAQGVAVYAALKREADGLHAQGDPRSPAQLMADLLISRVTGTPTADPGTASSTRQILETSTAARAGTWNQPSVDPTQSAPVNAADQTPGVVPAVEVQVVMTDHALFGDSDEAAYLAGYGPIPAIVARRVVREADRAWIRRLFTRPGAGDLVAMDSRRRRFTGGLRHLLILRDQVCRNAWCGAPIRHLDHITAYADEGATDIDNGQGLCQACNYVKQAPGWRTRLLNDPDGPHTVETTTPTGHRYQSTAPPQPGTHTERPFWTRLHYQNLNTA